MHPLAHITSFLARIPSTLIDRALLPSLAQHDVVAQDGEFLVYVFWHFCQCAFALNAAEGLVVVFDWRDLEMEVESDTRLVSQGDEGSTNECDTKRKVT